MRLSSWQTSAWAAVSYSAGDSLPCLKISIDYPGESSFDPDKICNQNGDRSIELLDIIDCVLASRKRALTILALAIAAPLLSISTLTSSPVHTTAAGTATGQHSNHSWGIAVDLG